MNALYFVFGIPLLGGLVLALVGHRSYARDLNVAFSAGSFIAACFLTVQVIDNGPMFAMDKQFLIDSLNVFLVSLTAFVGMTTAIFSPTATTASATTGRSMTSSSCRHGRGTSITMTMPPTRPSCSRSMTSR